MTGAHGGVAVRRTCRSTLLLPDRSARHPPAERQRLARPGQRAQAQHWDDIQLVRLLRRLRAAEEKIADTFDDDEQTWTVERSTKQGKPVETPVAKAVYAGK